MTTLFSRELLDQCILSNEEARAFRAASTRHVWSPPETELRVVAYYRPDGYVLIDEISLPQTPSP